MTALQVALDTHAVAKIREPRNLNLGDSIGLVALLFAFLSFAVDPTPWLKLVLLAVACVCLIVFIKTSAWTFRWGTKTKWVVSLTLIVGLTSHTATKLLQQTPIYIPLRTWLDSVIHLLHRPQALYVESALLGAALMLALLVFVGLVSQVQRKKQTREAAAKGFLDYKLDAEQGFRELPSKLSPLSAIIREVGEMMKLETAKTSSADAGNTNEHIQRLRLFSKRLRLKTETMDRSCNRLEATVSKLKAGIAGWSQWMIDTNQAGEHILIFKTTVETIAASNAEAVDSNKGYTRSLFTLIGISQDLNVSVQEHIMALERINTLLQGLEDTANAAVSGLTEQAERSRAKSII